MLQGGCFRILWPGATTNPTDAQERLGEQRAALGTEVAWGSGAAPGSWKRSPALRPAGQAASQLRPRPPPGPLVRVLGLSLPCHTLKLHRGKVQQAENPDAATDTGQQVTSEEQTLSCPAATLGPYQTAFRRRQQQHST